MAVVRVLIGALFLVALFGGGLALLRDPTGQNAFRWVMSMLFIGTVALYLGSRPR